jgi:hypothetical protein
MGIFELLFLLAVLGSVIVTMAALVFAVQGRGVRAFKIVRTYGICALAYLMAGVAMGFFKHQRLIGIGEPWCCDDGCRRWKAWRELQGNTKCPIVSDKRGLG